MVQQYRYIPVYTINFILANLILYHWFQFGCAGLINQACFPKNYLFFGISEMMFY